MIRIQLTNNLFLDEYIPKDLYLKYVGREHILIGLLDKRLITADQSLRNHFGVVTINNWWDKGERNWSGLRTRDSSYYSPTSQHSFGRASDKLFKDATPEEVWIYIENNWKELGITCIEKGSKVTWTHSDVRYWRGTNLLIVNP